MGKYRGSERHINNCIINSRKAMFSNISKPEIEFANKLNKLGINFIQQYRIEKYSYDFYIPSQNKLIEIDGKFFHPTRSEDCKYDFQLNNFNTQLISVPLKCAEN